jgi:hypothetical protein
MTKDTIRNHIDSFLLSVDPRGGFLRIAERIIDAVGHSPDTRKSIHKISVWIDQQSKKLVRQITKSGTSSDDFGSTARNTLLAIGYLQVLEKLRLLGSTGRVLKNFEIQPNTVDDILKSIEPQFMYRLLVETNRRANCSPVFFHELNAAMDEVRYLKSQTMYLRRSSQKLFFAQKEGTSTKYQGDEPDIRIQKMSEDERDGLFVGILLICIFVYCMARWPSLRKDDDDTGSENGDNE